MKSSALIVLSLLGLLTTACNRESVANTAPTAPLWAQMQQAVLIDQDNKKIQQILKAGFDINSPIGCGTFSALDGAVSVRNAKMLKLLLASGAKPEGRALVSAALCQNPDDSLKMVEILLRAGADVNYKDCYMNDPKRFFTALHWACYNGHGKVARLLLSQPGIELNNLDVGDKTPLMIAAENGNQGGIVQQLLEKGVDPLIKNSKGRTAADIAREQVKRDQGKLRQGILRLILDAETAANSSAK